MIEPDAIKEKVEAAFEEVEVEIADLTGTRDHYELRVVTPEFEDLSLIKRHRRIHDALSDEIEGPIHALKLDAKTPDETD